MAVGPEIDGIIVVGYFRHPRARVILKVDCHGENLCLKPMNGEHWQVMGVNSDILLNGGRVARNLEVLALEPPLQK